jgi:single-strand DNA-binding protein
MPSAVLIGNLTREPELRFSNSGSPMANFGLAVNRKWQNRATGEWDEKTSFFDVKMFGSLAENVAESLPKGARVVVTGRFEQETWETQEGDKRSKIVVIADEVSPSLRWATVQVEKNERSDKSLASAAATVGRAFGEDKADEEPF